MNYVITNPKKSSQIFKEKDVDKTDVKFNDPNKEYEILDDEEYSNADTFSNCPETPTTNTTENNDNHETHDFCLDEFAMNYVKEYATSMVTDFEKEEVESIWTSSVDDNENTDYELNGNGENIENQCVIIDIVDVWELDYNTVKTCVNANGQGSLHLLGVCSSHLIGIRMALINVA
ncbi:12054_t:CDS:2 [Funneliformis caledonium]|uniref:12054_t:CDS:1 n=1 Tax=Funneliformis caledonium TaxID=1117310 RepID=A0A9N9HFX1_9GLOM|nr:12054_t:CDS:2 [Funneliformis caledonium]